MGRDEPSIFWRNLALVAVFFALTPIALVASIISIVSIQPSVKAPTQVFPNQSKIGVSVYASLPSNVPSISGHITVADARPQIVKQYLSQFNSPLIPYSDEIVK